MGTTLEDTILANAATTAANTGISPDSVISRRVQLNATAATNKATSQKIALKETERMKCSATNATRWGTLQKSARVHKVANLDWLSAMKISFPKMPKYLFYFTLLPSLDFALL